MVIVHQVLYFLLALLLIAGGLLERNGWPPLITGLALLPIATWIFLNSRDIWPGRITISEAEIRYPKPGSLRSSSIPIADVAGVGLVYQWRRPGFGMTSEEGGNGWCLNVWSTDGTRTRLRTFRAISKFSGHRDGPKPSTKAGYHPELLIPFDTSEELAATKAGQVAILIYERALMEQGDQGPLATRSFQKTFRLSVDKGSWPRFYACWSPDGTISRAAIPESASAGKRP